MRELNEGFDEAFSGIGLDYEKADDMVKVADVVSNVLYELHEIMKDENLYEKYPMKNGIMQEDGNIFDEYERFQQHHLKEAITSTTESGNTYISMGNLGTAITESSLQSAAEVLNETVGKEYGINFSYESSHSDSKLFFEDPSTNKKYEIGEGDSLTDIIHDCERSEQSITK